MTNFSKDGYYADYKGSNHLPIPSDRFLSVRYAPLPSNYGAMFTGALVVLFSTILSVLLIAAILRYADTHFSPEGYYLTRYASFFLFLAVVGGSVYFSFFRHIHQRRNSMLSNRFSRVIRKLKELPQAPVTVVISILYTPSLLPRDRRYDSRPARRIGISIWHGEERMARLMDAVFVRDRALPVSSWPEVSTIVEVLEQSMKDGGLEPRFFVTVQREESKSLMGVRLVSNPLDRLPKNVANTLDRMEARLD